MTHIWIKDSKLGSTDQELTIRIDWIRLNGFPNRIRVLILVGHFTFFQVHQICRL